MNWGFIHQQYYCPTNFGGIQLFKTPNLAEATTVSSWISKATGQLKAWSFCEKKHTESTEKWTPHFQKLTRWGPRSLLFSWIYYLQPWLNRVCWGYNYLMTRGALSWPQTKNMDFNLYAKCFISEILASRFFVGKGSQDSLNTFDPTVWWLLIATVWVNPPTLLTAESVKVSVGPFIKQWIDCLSTGTTWGGWTQISRFIMLFEDWSLSSNSSKLRAWRCHWLPCPCRWLVPLQNWLVTTGIALNSVLPSLKEN